MSKGTVKALSTRVTHCPLVQSREYGHRSYAPVTSISISPMCSGHQQQRCWWYPPSLPYSPSGPCFLFAPSLISSLPSWLLTPPPSLDGLLCHHFPALTLGTLSSIGPMLYISRAAAPSSGCLSPAQAHLDHLDQPIQTSARRQVSNCSW